MSDQPAAAASAAPEPAAAASAAPEPAAAASAAPEPAADLSAAEPAAAVASAAEPTAAVTPAAPPPPPVDAEAVMAGFINRIGQGEFDQPEDAFHRFVVKEIYPLLGSGTLTAKDLDLIAHVYSARADPYNRGSDTPEDAKRLAGKPR